MAETHHFEASSLFDCSGYVCLVTGGGSGIGLMASQALSANGAKVYITGRRMEALETAAREHKPHGKGQIIPIGPCDVTKKEELEKLVKMVEEKEKFINMLFCNAGIAGPKASPEHSKAEDLKKEIWENEDVESWNDTYNTDVTSVYFTAVAFLPLLQAAMSVGGAEQFAPSIITTSSMSGQMRHAQNHFAYNAAKGATVQLTKLMSAEFQRLNIRINSVAPGYFPSEMSAKDSDERMKSEMPAEQVQEKGHVPAMRAGRETEMGQTILFLTKNNYIQGQIITVDGGVLNVIGS